MLLKNDKHNCKTAFYCRKRNVTFKAVKVLSLLKKLCQTDEHCDMEFCEKSNNTEIFENIYLVLGCVLMLNAYVNIREKIEVQGVKSFLVKKKSP